MAERAPALAELVAADGTRFPIAAADVLVGRSSEDGTFLPDINLGIVRDGRTVSRRHARLFRSVGAWHLQAEPSARNVTVVGGQRLGPRQHAALNDGAEITLGKVPLVFRTRRAAEQSAHLEAAPREYQATAELHSGAVKIPLLAPEGRPLRVGRHSDDGRYAPDVDLADVTSGRTVSRKHAEFERRAQTWFMRVQADVTNPTYLNGELLQRGQEVRLSDGDQLRLGLVEATFHTDGGAREVESDVLDLTLGPPTEMRVDPGTPAVVPLSLVNFSGRVDWFKFALSGLPSDWYRIHVATSADDQPPVVRLLTGPPPVPTPESTARATLTLAPPRTARARAGMYPVLVSATSEGEERLRRTVPGQVTVLPFFDLRLVLGADQLRGCRGSSAVSLTNLGNSPLDIALSATADNNLEVRFDDPRLTLLNGASFGTRARVRMKHWHWFGPDRTCAASITAAADGALAQQALQLTCPPRIPRWLQRVLGFVKSIFKPIVLPVSLIALALAVWYFVLRPPDVTLVATRDLVGKGDTAALRWTVARGSGDATLDTPDGPREVPLRADALETPPLQETFDFKVHASTWMGKWFGIVGTRSVRVRVVRIDSLTASTMTIKQPGEPVTLEWQTENASNVRLDVRDQPDQTISSLPTKGSLVVKPTKSTTYVLVASDASGTALDQWLVPIGFGSADISKFEVNPPRVHPGDKVTLSWTATGYTTLTVSGDPDDLELSSDLDVTRRASAQAQPLHSGRYHLLARNADDTPVEAFADVVVDPIGPARLLAPSRPVAAGDPATLTWQVDGANDRTTLSIDQGVGDVTGRTSVDVQPLQTTSYRLTATGADGQKIVSDPATTVLVKPAVKEFKAEPATVVEGAPVSLKWTVVDADTVSVVRDDGATFEGQANSGVILDHPPVTVTSYQITARNASGESTATARLTVAPAPTPTAVPTPTVLPTPATPAMPLPSPTLPVT